MLFHIKQPEVFRLRMDGFLAAAEKSRPDAVRSTGKIGEVEYVSVATPDRAIHVFSAYPKPNLHVRSNSKPALERVLAAMAGDKDVPRLGEAIEFRYIRTLMPRGDEREDGLGLSLRSVHPPAGGAGTQADRSAGGDLLQPSADDRPRGDALPHAVRQGAGIARRTGCGRLRPGVHADSGPGEEECSLPLRRPVFARGRRAERRLLASRQRPGNGPLQRNSAGASDAKRRPKSIGNSSRSTANIGGGISIPSPCACRSLPSNIERKRSSCR